VSEEDDNAAGDGTSLFDNSRRTRAQRVEDFIRAAGGSPNRVLEVIRKQPIRDTLDAAVTDEHRELVIDLKASGCPDDVIARFFMISEHALQRLFAWELANGLPLRTVEFTQALRTNGVLLGDTSAILGYLRLQPDLAWKSKSQVDKDDGEREERPEEKQANEEFIAGVIAGLTIDKTKFKPAERVAPKPAAAPVVKKIGYNAQTARKPRQEP
jgi:hypothetical protein